MRALVPDAAMRKPMLSPSPIASTVIVPPRGMVCSAMINMFKRSLTRFFGKSAAGRF
jgi:hypothetical protein